jgi:cell division protein FtsQ
MQFLFDGEDKVILPQTYRLIKKVKQYFELIKQIDVDEKGDLFIIPRIGQHEIAFGKPDNIESKFKKLMAFYEHIIPNAGWDMYSTINLQYTDQIVCTKRDIKNTKTINKENT